MADDTKSEKQEAQKPISELSTQEKIELSPSVTNGVIPSEVQFTSGDEIDVNVDGVWKTGIIKAVTPIGVPDSNGETVKYTVQVVEAPVSTGAITGQSVHQYVPQSCVRARGTVDETQPVEADADAKTPVDEPEETAPTTEDKAPSAEEVSETTPEVTETPQQTPEVVDNTPTEDVVETPVTPEVTEAPVAPEEPTAPVVEEDQKPVEADAPTAKDKKSNK